MKNDPYTICFTGHRELSQTQTDAAAGMLLNELGDLLELHGDGLRAISGMAKGVDQLAAYTCIELGIPWCAAVPHSGYPIAYGLAGEQWDNLLAQAHNVVYVVNDTVDWKPTYNFVRNEKMLDWSDLCIGVTWWDVDTEISRTHRPRGGTSHMLQLCIRREFPTKILQLERE